jgi:hypothetical protein
MVDKIGNGKVRGRFEIKKLSGGALGSGTRTLSLSRTRGREA